MATPEHIEAERKKMIEMMWNWAERARAHSAEASAHSAELRERAEMWRYEAEQVEEAARQMTARVEAER